MNANKLLLAALFASAIAAPSVSLAQDKNIATSLKLPIEGEMPAPSGATGWLNSPPLNFRKPFRPAY